MLYRQGAGCRAGGWISAYVPTQVVNGLAEDTSPTVIHPPWNIQHRHLSQGHGDTSRQCREMCPKTQALVGEGCLLGSCPSSCLSTLFPIRGCAAQGSQCHGRHPRMHDACRMFAPTACAKLLNTSDRSSLSPKRAFFFSHLVDRNATGREGAGAEDGATGTAPRPRCNEPPGACTQHRGTPQNARLLPPGGLQTSRPKKRGG